MGTNRIPEHECDSIPVVIVLVGITFADQMIGEGFIFETKTARSPIGQRSGCSILNSAYAVIALRGPRHWRLGYLEPERRLRLDDSSDELLRTNSARPVDAARNPKFPSGFR